MNWRTLGRVDKHLVVVAFETDVGSRNVIGDQEIDRFVLQLGFGMSLEIVRLRGETDTKRPISTTKMKAP